MWNLLTILALAAATSPEVTATKLDGTSCDGRLESWQDRQLTLATADGPLQFAEADLLAVQFAPATPAAPRQPAVELVDGSVLPLADFTVFGEDSLAKFPATAAPDLSEPRELAIPVEQIRAVLLQSLDEAVVEQWEEIRGLNAPGDVLVVAKRGGRSLDYLEGVVGAISDSEVEFRIDGRSVRVAREKVAGVVYYRGDSPADVESPVVLVGRQGLRLVATSVDWEGDELDVVTAAGVVLTWPLAEISSADFSAGKVVFLSDLRPAAQSWRPLVGLPAAAAHLARYGQPRFDQAATGGPLSLAYEDPKAADGRKQSQSFAKGIALRSRTELVYRLPRGYSRFVAVAGIEPVTGASGNVRLAVVGDERVLVERSIAGDEPPLPIEVDVAGVRRLKIVVDYGQNLDTGDWLNLCNARIVK